MQRWRTRFQLLAAHRHLQTLVDQLSNCIHTGDPWVAQGAWAELESAVLAHVEMEEQELLAPYDAADPVQARRIRAEHDEIRATLADLGVRLDLHAVSEDAVAQLGRTLYEHVLHEERTMYQWATQHPAQAAVQALRTRLRRLRSKRATHSRWRSDAPPR